jgi:AraC-like DNA-binding protein
LRNALKKYGEENLHFEVLEKVSLTMPGDKVLLLEQKWWDVFAAQGVNLYNGRPTGTGSVYHTEETRRKIAATAAAKRLLQILEVESDVRQLASAGFSINEIAEQLSRTKYLVRATVDYFQLAPKNPEQRRRSKKESSFANETHKKAQPAKKRKNRLLAKAPLEELFLQKHLTLQEVAKIYGCTPELVHIEWRGRGYETFRNTPAKCSICGFDGNLRALHHHRCSSSDITGAGKSIAAHKRWHLSGKTSPSSTCFFCVKDNLV